MRSITFVLKTFVTLCLLAMSNSISFASSHREAPLIANDPLADNVDLYAFKSPDDPNSITIIATYVPMQLPYGGPNYFSFGQNIRYEIHVDNDASIPGDEVTYRFTFFKQNEDPTTFFNIRLGKQNLKTTYMVERSLNNGTTWDVILTNGVVPPYNIGPRSIEGGAGMGQSYEALFKNAIMTASSGETIFAGPTDDPFFVDLGGIFDLGDASRQLGKPVDGLACMNVSAIAIKIPIGTLLKKGAAAVPANILDPDYVIGVWASASRKAITTLSSTSDPSYSGDWVQVSRLGMPLTNEAVIPIGKKDFWNSLTPYQEIGETTLDQYFMNPELALYMDDDLFGGAVPAFSKLRIQKKSLGGFDFTNGADGLYGLKGNPALAGTALDDAVFGTLLLPGAGQPRAVDLWPAFHTGVPNVIPYQLATGKAGNPLAKGKPFVHNFLPNGGDMLRLNMAVPATPRDDANFSSLGLVQAAAIGLTVAPFNTNTDVEFMPNMDGFPNGRRLEDDVTRIELQAVAGVVLAAVGLWYDDYDPATSASPLTPGLLNVLTYTTGVEKNDKKFQSTFPYLAMPHRGTDACNIGNVNGGDVASTTPKTDFYVSSNTAGKIGVYTVNDDKTITSTSFISGAVDADGIYYDEKSDLLIQVNRSKNVLNMYKNANASIRNKVAPSVAATSTSNFINGREIAVSANKIIVLQDANAANGNKDAFVIYNYDASGFTYDKTLYPSVNLWGAYLDGNTLYAVEDNSNRVLTFNSIFSKADGNITADKSITIEGLVRTHGITYKKSGDIMVLTDIGDAAKADDGAFIMIRDFGTKAADGTVSSSEQIRVGGAQTGLGNPVDISYDEVNEAIYIAERAVGGGRVVAYKTPSTSGDFAPVYTSAFAGASAIYLAGDTKAYSLVRQAQLIGASNTQAKIASFFILEDGSIDAVTSDAASGDADGVHHDHVKDILYVADRVNNKLSAYNDYAKNVTQGSGVAVGVSSSSDFSNAREITAAGDRIVVAQDANTGNGNQNKLVVYQVTSSGLIKKASYDVAINLWGIQADINTLYAVVDNSNQLAVFNDFFQNYDGPITPSKTITVTGIGRTHGLTYDHTQDLMIMTDIGDAASNSDGAIVVIKNFTTAAADNTISADEQIRVSGLNSKLGNPVDVAYASQYNMIYIAERALGKMYGFAMPTASGDQAPAKTADFAGISSLYLSGFVREGQPITSVIDLTDGTQAQIDLYPNPVVESIQVKVSSSINAGEVSYTIYDLQGRQVASGNRIDEAISVSQLTRGQYHIKMSHSKFSHTIAFTKM